MATSLITNCTAKELVDMGGSSFFSFETNSSASLAVKLITKKEIPVVDFTLLRTGTPDQRSQIIRVIGEACDEWGCFHLVNHGVSESLRTSTMGAFVEFFQLSVEERNEYLGKKILDPIRHETGLVTMMEGEQYWRDFVRIFVHPTFHCPSKPLHLRAICEEYARQTREISIKLLTAIGESLGLEESYMKTALDVTNGHQILVANRYPPRQPPELALGLPSHSDTPLLTILMQNGTIDGLEVMHDSQWVPVQLIPGSFFIHSGDLLEIVSNGRYKSLSHRVILNNKSTRMSVVTALGVPIEKVVAPAPKLAEIANNTSAFRSMKYIEFVGLTKSNPFGKSALSLLKP